MMDSLGTGGGASKKSSMWRLIAGVSSVISLLFFAGAWVGTIVTSGFSLTNSHTFAGWLYFPLLWPHFAAATLGFLMFMRYGANWITALVTLALWGGSIVSDLYATILYWRLGWLCNISGLGSLTAVEKEICANEDPLLISLWVTSTLVLLLAIGGALGQAFDLVKTGKAGKSAPRIQISAPVIIMVPFGILSALLLFAFWAMNVLNSGESLIGRQAFAVWTHANVFSLQIPATILSIMLGVRYGSNWATAIAAPILWGISFFAAFFGTGLYWQLGWFCQVAAGSPMTGVDLEICNKEEHWLTAVWVMVSILGLTTITNFIAHINDIGTASAQGQSLNPLRGFYRPNLKKFFRRKGGASGANEEGGKLSPGLEDLEGPGDDEPLLLEESGAGGGVADGGDMEGIKSSSDARRFFNSAAAAGRYIQGGGVDSAHLNDFIQTVVPYSPSARAPSNRAPPPSSTLRAPPSTNRHASPVTPPPPRSAAGEYLATRRVAPTVAPAGARQPPQSPLSSSPLSAAETRRMYGIRDSPQKPLPTPPLSTTHHTASDGLRRKRAVDDASPTLN